MSRTPNDLPSSADHKRGQAIIEYVSTGLAAASGGLSEAIMLPLRRVLERRAQELEEAIVEDLRKGRISESDIIEDERLASFILRARRAAFEGVGKRKLRLMARIFFKDATGQDYLEDTLQDFWGITEQLNAADMMVLSILKKADLGGYLVPPNFTSREEKAIRYTLDVEQNFNSEEKFNEAVGGLLRFGLVDAVSGWGSLIYFPTERCLNYIRHLDFNDLD